MIDFLTLQFVNEPCDTTKNINRSNNHHHKNTNGSSKVNHNGAVLEKSNDSKTRKEVVITDVSMLNNINSRGLSKSTKVEVLHYQEATSSNMVDKIGDALDGKPELLIVHLGTNDLTNDINILNIEKSCHSNKEKITWNSLKLSKHDNLER